MQPIRHYLSKLVNKILPWKKIISANGKLYGSISIQEEEGIKRAIQLSSGYDGPIVEIGVLFGHTTNLIASVADPAKKIIAVDNFRWNPFGLSPESHKQFTERTLRYIVEHRNTEIWNVDSGSFFKHYHGPTPSMIFIDAGHDYKDVLHDIKVSVAMGIPVISGHDFSPQHEGVKKAVIEMFKDNFDVYGTVWVSKYSSI